MQASAALAAPGYSFFYAAKTCGNRHDTRPPIDGFSRSIKRPRTWPAGSVLNTDAHVIFGQ